MDEVMAGTILLGLLVVGISLLGAAIASLENSPKTCKALLLLAALFAAPVLCRVWVALVLG